MYGVEKFIAKCLDSIICQAYDNLEIICVNDGTKDNSANIAKEYEKRDSRVKVLDNPKNLGLFRARVEGLKIAKGKYMAFVDADDYISVDWFRLLMKKITEEQADMVIGNTVNVDENGYAYYYNNYRNLTTSHETICGDNLLETFYKQEGACFIWHTVWNKVYSMDLVRRCMPYFEKIDFHMIMGEDIAFSSVFYTHAKKLCFANADCYFYYRHSEASTSITLPKEKIIKNILDLKSVFDYCESCLSEYSEELYDRYKPLISNFKERYQRTWRGNLWSAKIQNDPEALKAMKTTFGVENGELPRPHDFYFYELTTPWSDRYESLKKAILWEKHKVISFDLFDTLIMRPFYDPTDVLFFVAKEAEKIVPFLKETTFKQCRLQADNLARKKMHGSEVTLTQIYDCLAEICNISNESAKKIQQVEEELELKYCYARNVGKELFDLAISTGKTVIIVSDMYLETKTVQAILDKNGYKGYNNLYLSSETKTLKADGKMYKTVISSVDAHPDEILHIGDNWNNDIVTASKYGIKTFFLPRAIETFENGISDIYTGNSAHPFKNKDRTSINSTDSMRQLPLRCAVGIAANKLFDNPFTPFQESSNFNGDSYYMGYYALGMHVLGLAKWIHKTAKNNGYEKIVFLARDGKMLKDVFDYLCKKTNSPIKTEYFYATRKALMPYSIGCAEDFFNIGNIVDLSAHTPLSIIALFQSILKPLDNNAKNEYHKLGVNLDAKLDDQAIFFKFVNALIKVSYSEELRVAAFDKASIAFKNVFNDKTATFDIGYSGRLQSIICELSGCSIDAFFVHTNGYNTTQICKNKFNIHSYYDYSPTISGIIREYFMSDPTPSCYAYDINGNSITPLLEKPTDSTNFESTYAIKEMQKAAIDYCKNYIDTFADLGDSFSARNSDYAIAIEHLLLTANEFDRYTFSNAIIEDEVYSAYSARNLFETWTWHLSTMPIPTEKTVQQVSSLIHPSEGMLDISKGNKLKKAIAYFLFDKRLFKEKLKNKFKRQK